MDKREINREIRNLHKTWSKVDSQIALPATLTGDALLPLLDDIPAPQRVGRDTRRKIQFSPRVFSWQSVSTYAAALVLIVGLSALLSRTPPDIQPGSIDFDDSSPNASPAQEFSTPGNLQREESGEGVAEYTPEESAPDTESPEESALPGESDGQPATDGESPEPRENMEINPEDHLGGPDQSVVLHKDDQYTYSWRRNDPTDPDRSGYPVAVTVLDTETEELALLLDIAAIQDIEESFLYGDRLSLVGTSPQGDEVVLVYDLSQPGYADNVVELHAPGTLLDARIHHNVVNIVTYASPDADLDCEVIELPNSTGENFCVISAVDLDTGHTEQKAFSGSGQSISLYNLNAYLYYEGEATEDNPQGRHVAHIRLNGLDIELRNEE